MKIFKNLIYYLFDFKGRAKSKEIAVLNKSESNELEVITSVRNTQTKSTYKAQKSRSLYTSQSAKFKISRTKLALFIKCPRCFYFDVKLGVRQPPGYPLSLNLAVDALLKKEFDGYRAEQKPHPFCVEAGLNVVPFNHSDIEKWRNSLHAGIQYIVPNTNIMLYGGLDDVWIDLNTNQLIVVDYKATSKSTAVSLDADWQITYKQQVEIYQWLLRKNGFLVSNVAYFVYCNGLTNVECFDKQLKFDVALLPYEGNDSWIESSIIEAYKCLQMDTPPVFSPACNFCQYWEAINNHIVLVD